jgi:hypothetical protein
MTHKYIIDSLSEDKLIHSRKVESDRLFAIFWNKMLKEDEDMVDVFFRAVRDRVKEIEAVREQSVMPDGWSEGF